MRIECNARELHDRIDEAWEQEHPTCPACEGVNLTEDGRTCFDCTQPPAE